METSGSGDESPAAAQETSRDFSKYLPLYNAALSGDWETAHTLFFEKNRDEAEAIICLDRETALHVAVQSGRANGFVRKLVGLMSPQALALRNSRGQTALHEAAKVGNTEAAMTMLQKYPPLLYMLCGRGRLAVTTAALYSQKDTLNYLLSVSKPDVENSPFQGKLGIALLVEVIGCEFFDVALDLVDKYPDLARLGWDNGHRCALSFMAEMESAFPSRESFRWWEKFIYRLTKGIKDKKEMHLQALELAKYLCREMKFLPEKVAIIMLKDSMLRAAEHGICEIVQMIMDMYPVVTTSVDSTGKNIMHLAAINRFENVFNLTYDMSDRKHLFSNGVDFENNNLMHMCARLAPPHKLNLVPGAALQMQRELQWFNEMERFVPPSRGKWGNNNSRTPKQLFTEQHEKLKAEGERWMKDTATACSIATALISTVVFAAAFTVPGGVSSETGDPIFFKLKIPSFVLFVVTNAVSLFTSITSLMMFLSILTSRYAEQDFLHVLPKRLSFGLLTLFISITFMLVAFSSALYLVFRQKKLWFIIPMAAFGSMPVASFVLLQFPLLVDVVYSTYGPGIFGKKTNRLFF
ncbi:hypothetical protein ACS0TY_033796 [Phlomoides rotata]